VEAEVEEDEAESSSSDEGFEEDAIPDIDEEQESSDEAEVSTPPAHSQGPPHFSNKPQASGPNHEANDESESESEDEQIIVTRQEEERDPATEAEFDREFEKMMAESMDSRRFERKTVFDIPLPMKRPPRENMPSDSSPEPVPAVPVAPKTMAFSLMTKKGNKQQVSLHIYIHPNS
jgi:regulator of nonsense transcripts 2